MSARRISQSHPEKVDNDYNDDDDENKNSGH